MMDNSKKQKILYIAGYSRAGSTIVDMVLNSHPKVASAGELAFLHEDAENISLKCGCGEPYSECPIYGPWLSDFDMRKAKHVKQVEQRSNLKNLLDGRVPSEAASFYRTYANSLFDHLHSAHDAQVIVDGSKSARDAAGRPLALRDLAGRDVRVLHLTRDPRATMNSYLKTGSNWVLEGRRAARPLDSWRPIIGWTLANRVAQKVAAQFDDNRHLHLPFESFLADPAAALNAIGALIDLDLSYVASKVVSGAQFDAGHSVGGNRARLEPQRITLDIPVQPPLPSAYALGLNLIGGRIARQLGYD